MPAPKDPIRKELWKKRLRESSLKAGIVPPSKKGVSPSKDTRKKISNSLIRLGHVPPSALGIKRSDKWKEKVKKNHAKYWKGRKGKESANWKGGLTPQNHLIRSSIKYKEWQKSVLKRDDYTGRKYKIRGGCLQVHHILCFAEYPNLRFDINNGITLSKKAHKEFHKKYGRKNNTKKQLLEFLKD